MVEQYQPQGAIDYTMIEVLAVNYFLWMYSTEEHLKRATTEPRRENYDYCLTLGGSKPSPFGDGFSRFSSRAKVAS